jgi:hypothetical protein
MINVPDLASDEEQRRGFAMALSLDYHKTDFGPTATARIFAVAKAVDDWIANATVPEFGEPEPDPDLPPVGRIPSARTLAGFSTHLPPG